MSRPKIRDEVVEQIREQLALGHSVRKIATMVLNSATDKPVSTGTVMRVRAGA